MCFPMRVWKFCCCPPPSFNCVKDTVGGRNKISSPFLPPLIRPLRIQRGTPG